MAEHAYVVEVNEGAVEATRQGVAWWHARRQAFVASGRLHEAKAACVIGGTIEIACDSEDDAKFMANHMVEAGGLPSTAVKVKRQPQRTTIRA